MHFIPKRIFFEPLALEYPLGQEIYKKAEALGIPIKMTGSHNRVTGLPGKNTKDAFREAKQTLVVGVRKSLDFAACKPSANYQLPLNTSCPGKCEYCYLATTLGRKPYLRVYVNIEKILERTEDYINKNAPNITVFEGAATSDPIPTEHLTGLLKKTIEFFGRQPFGRFRFVTKFTDIDSLLNIEHNGHTRFRFSVNARAVIKMYEHATPRLEERIAAAVKVAEAGYPLGFIIAPIFHFTDWQLHYGEIVKLLAAKLPQNNRDKLTFELISHRFTKRAKANILALFPETALPLNEQERRFKYGQFGYGKYLYGRDTMDDISSILTNQIKFYFPQAKIDYFV